MNSSNDPNTFIGADNQIADLLAAPIIRDAQNIVWYAAGAKNTWLCITKTSGAADIQVFSRNKMAFEAQAMYLDEFRHHSLRPDPADARGLTEDLSRNHYAIGQLAIACGDAWSRSDWQMHNDTMALLEQYVPSVADVCKRAKIIDNFPLRAHQRYKYAIGETLHELDAIEALSDDPKGLATLDPWFRAQQLVRLLSKAHPCLHQVHPDAQPAQPDSQLAHQTTLYALESETEKSFLLVHPVAEKCGEFNLWLTASMQPLLTDYLLNGATNWIESPGYAWEWHRPYPGSLAGWSNAMAGMEQINAAPFDSLKKGAMRALSPEETLAAIEAWAANTESMAAWNNVDDPSALVFLGDWAIKTWTAANPASGQLLNGLLPSIDSAVSPGQFDAWRQLMVLAQPAAEANAALPEFLNLAHLV